MPVLNVVYDKLEINRKINAEVKAGNIKVNSNSGIRSIQKIKLPKIGDALEIKFEYSTIYDPEIGDLTIQGRVLYHSKKVSNLVEKKGNDLVIKDKDVFEEVNNIILRSASVQALLLTKEMNFPSPIHLPTLKVKEMPESKGIYA